MDTAFRRQEYNRFLRSKEFTSLPFKSQADFILSKLDWLADMTPESISYYTTPILRADCNCTFEVIIDETTGESIEMEEHGNGCHRVRYPIEEDLSDSTIKRRNNRHVLSSNEMLMMFEEGFFA